MLEVREFLTQWEKRPTVYVSEDGGRSLTYAELNRVAAVNALKLIEWGIGKENVALIAFNSIDWIVAYWSLLLAGSTVVPLNPKSTDQELRALLKTCDCKWMICDQKSIQTAGSLADSIGIGRLDIRDANLSISCVPNRPGRKVRSANVPIMCCTSGSTGKSRAVMLSDENLLANTASHTQSLKLSSQDVVLITLPLHYSYAHTAQFLCHTRLGGPIVLYDYPVFSPRLFCQLIERHRITITSLVPTLLHILNSYRYLDHYDLTSLRYLCCGGAPIEAGTATTLMAKLPHTRLVHTYGLTEASPRVTTLAPEQDLAKLPSIGKPMPGVEIRIMSGTKQPAASCQVGELQVRGKNVMAGYYGDSEETAAVISDGWLSTGDLARSDSDGYIYLVGRTKNIIINGGINVSPEEIESVLLTHVDIREVVVKAEYSPNCGEQVAAYVSLKNGNALSLQQLHEFLRGKLAQWKWPTRLYLRPSLSRTTSGKVRRHDVR